MTHYRYYVDVMPIRPLLPLLSNVNDLATKGWRLAFTLPIDEGQSIMLIWERPERHDHKGGHRDVDD